MHTPVLLQKVIEYLAIKPNGLYIDATLGEGGYSREIIKRGGRVLAIEIDKKQIANFKEKNKNLKIVWGNFKDIKRIAKENNYYPVDGVVFDLGLSMNQIKFSGRGFSYKNLNEPLDMRLDLSSDLTVAKLLSQIGVNDLYQILAKNSEEPRSFSIAIAIKKAKRMILVEDLIKAINRVVKRNDESVYRRIFQGLRMAVNNERESLKEGLKGALEILKDNSRILTITFHSVEDRVVKNFIKDNRLKMLTKKVLLGSRERQIFERSARLRIIVSQ